MLGLDACLSKGATSGKLQDMTWSVVLAIYWGLLSKSNSDLVEREEGLEKWLIVEASEGPTLNIDIGVVVLLGINVEVAIGEDPVVVVGEGIVGGH